MLDLTQADLARLVSCSISMLRKIERDERRPSEQLADLLADHLAVDQAQRESFLQMARGNYLVDLADPVQTESPLIPALAKFNPPHELVGFVARERELAFLSEHLNKAVQGQGRIVFIAGEAGRGKTSLLVEFARRSQVVQPDLLVAGGNCNVFAGQGDPLLPFRDIFRMLTGDLENAGMRAILNHELAKRLFNAIPTIAQTLLEYGPNLMDRLFSGSVLETHLAYSASHLPENTKILLRLKRIRSRQSLATTSEGRQDNIFDETSSTLSALAQQHPLLLVLDDLHWIDHSSAALLGRLPVRLKESPILIVGSYRPEDMIPLSTANDHRGPRQHPLQEVLSESLRQFGHNRIDLDHYGPSEELDFVNALLDVTDNTFSVTFREHFARLTEGHPLFVVELLRDMKERGDIVLDEAGYWKERKSTGWKNLPARVEGVIEKRITRLPSEWSDLLAIASVQGETFFAEVLARIKQVDPRNLTRQLSAYLDRQHRLVHEQGVKHAGAERLSQYQFRHHLFQKYLYEWLSPAERMYLHEAVGNALEALFKEIPNQDDLPSAQLARHFQEARLHKKASRYLLLAGHRAARMLAFEEAAAYFEAGLVEIHKLAPTSEIAHLEYELSLALARARWHAGLVRESVDTFTKTIEIARGLQDPQSLARAVLAYEEPRWRLNLDSDISQRFIREALEGIGDEQSGLRVRLLVNLARSLLASGSLDELRATVEQALEIARRTDDPLALCDALRIKVQIDRRPETTAARLTAIREMIAAAESIPDQERLADAYDLYVYDLLELGQIEEADEMIAAQSRAAEEIKQPFQMHVATVFQTMRAILRGEFEKAAQLANQAADLSRQIGLAELDGIFGIHMFTIRREQGRIHEIAPLLKRVVANNPVSSTWRPGLALMYATLGMQAECKSIFEILAADGFITLPQDSLWVATLAYLSEVCAFLGDRGRAARLYELLLPYDGRTVVVGGATACYGAVSRFLGTLAATCRDWKAGRRHFENALALDERIQAWPWLAHSQAEYARMLLRQGREQDRPQAEALLAEALRTAQRLGMAYLAHKVGELQMQHQLNSG
jgi:tetratricopeptide (TPR) repeat protein/transcriptional regulator with XRE-family HTH domain